MARGDVIGQAALVSIVMPLYNCEKYIVETLQSVKNQTHQNYQVILIDDCSLDATNKIVTDFIAGDERFKLYKNEQNCGVARSRNRGFDLATGEYIALLDADDIWLDTKLERQLQQMLSVGADVSYTSYRFISDSSDLIDKIYHTKKGRAEYRDLLKENFIGCSTSMFRRTLADNYKMDPAAYHEDYYFWLTLIKTGCLFSGIDEVLVHYRLADGGRSKDKFRALYKRYEILHKLEGLSVIKTLYFLLIYGVNGLKKHWRFMID